MTCLLMLKEVMMIVYVIRGFFIIEMMSDVVLEDAKANSVELVLDMMKSASELIDLGFEIVKTVTASVKHDIEGEEAMSESLSFDSEMLL